MGVLVFLIIYTGAPIIASVYGEPLLSNVIRWLSIVFLVQPLGQQYYILLQKNLDFKGIAIRDVVSKSLGLIGGVIAAYLGIGVYALVVSHVLMVCSSTIMLIIIGRKIHVPVFYFKLQEVTEYLQFGMYQLGERGINYLNLQMDTLIIGKVLGVEVLGIYTIAKDLVLKPAQLINPIITKVAFPLMAKIQGSKKELQRVYFKTVRGLTTINAPLFLFMAFFSSPIITLLFGEEWLAAAPVLSILSIYMMLRSTGNPVGALMMAKGRADLGFYWNLGLSLFIPLAVFAGVSHGIQSVCYALVVMQVILFYPGWRILVFKLCRMKFLPYFKAVYIPILNAGVAGALGYWLIAFFDFQILLGLIMAAAIFGGMYFTISSFNNSLLKEYNLTKIISKKMKAL